MMRMRIGGACARLGTPRELTVATFTLCAVALTPSLSFAVQTKIQIAPEFRRWTFERPRVEHRIDQSYVAADLEFQFDSGLDLAAGGNFVSTVHHEEDMTGNLDRLGELRIRGEQRLLSDRLRVRARAAFPLEEDGFLPREIRALRVLEIPELEFPLADAGVSSHQEIELTGQVVRRRTLLAQLGIGLEERGSYQLRETDLEFDPGGTFRMAGSVDHALSRWIVHHGLIWERPGTSALAGRDAFRNGVRITWSEGIALHRAGTVWRADVALLFGKSGELYPGSSLVEDPLRSGNRVRWRLAHERGTSWPIEVAFTGTHYRGFAGTLGHADWITPSLCVGRRFGPGMLEGAFDFSVGTVREGGSLGGVGARLGWRGGLN